MSLYPSLPASFWFILACFLATIPRSFKIYVEGDRWQTVPTDHKGQQVLQHSPVHADERKRKCTLDTGAQKEGAEDHKLAGKAYFLTPPPPSVACLVTFWYLTINTKRLGCRQYRYPAVQSLHFYIQITTLLFGVCCCKIL